jgi:hypothetical protein
MTGVPGDTLYAWQEETREGWGTILALVPMLGFQGLLMHRDEKIAREVFGDVAHGHVAATGNPLRFARFEMTEVLERHG